MAVLRILGDEVVSRSRYLNEVASRSTLEALADLESHPLKAAFALPGLEADAGPGATEFAPIGLGQPLTILIRDVYTGRHPKKSILGGGGKHMAVVSALKDYATFAPSSRAVNFMEKDIGAHKHLRAPAATSAGTNIVAYSPAVLSDQLHYTVEMTFDRFPEGLVDAIGGAFKTAANLPILLPAQNYLLAAGSVIKIVSEWGNALADGKAAFSVTDTLDFNIPGSIPPSADFRVLGSEEHEGLKYDPARGLLRADGKPYDGDEPYVVVSLDGAARPALETFAPTLATAEQLKQFFAMKDGTEASIEAVVEGLKLATDLKYRDQAKNLKAALATEPDGPKKQDMQKRLSALQDNILSPELKLKD
jgi:hypothetical protein